MKFNFIDAEKTIFPVQRLCSVMEVSRSGFYRWLSSGPSKRELEDRSLTEKIREIHSLSRGNYGSPRVHLELREARRIAVGKKRVERLMRAAEIRARRKKPFRRTTDSRKTHAPSPNLVERNFTAPRPNAIWVTDVKAIRVAEGWLFIAAILDLYSRRLVGWSVSARNDTDLILEALERAVKSRRRTGDLIHHSDRGSPYASDRYRSELKRCGMTQSMSRKGDCWDNAVAESFFSTLEWEHLGTLPVRPSLTTRIELADYLEFYNHQRRHSSAGNLNPVEYELRNAIPTGAA